MFKLSLPKRAQPFGQHAHVVLAVVDARHREHVGLLRGRESPGRERARHVIESGSERRALFAGASLVLAASSTIESAADIARDAVAAGAASTSR